MAIHVMESGKFENTMMLVNDEGVLKKYGVDDFVKLVEEKAEDNEFIEFVCSNENTLHFGNPVEGPLDNYIKFPFKKVQFFYVPGNSAGCFVVDNEGALWFTHDANQAPMALTNQESIEQYKQKIFEYYNGVLSYAT